MSVRGCSLLAAVIQLFASVCLADPAHRQEPDVGAGMDVNTIQLGFSFRSDVVTVFGALPDKEEATPLVEMLRNIRPGAKVFKADNFTYREGAWLPDLLTLRSVLSELSVSFADGRLTFFPDRILLEGLTDSPVSLSALRVRLRPLVQGRPIHDRVCLVPTEDLLPYLPEQEVAGNDPAPILATPVAQPLNIIDERPVQLAGLEPDKWLSYLEQAAPKATVPLAVAAEEPKESPWRRLNFLSKRPKSSDPEIASTAPEPVQTRAMPVVEKPKTLFRAEFRKNSDKLVADSEQSLRDVAPIFAGVDWGETPIHLHAIPSKGARPALEEYQMERRLDRVKTALVEAGVAAERITPNLRKDRETDGLPEVLILAVAPRLETSETSSAEPSPDGLPAAD